MTENKIAVVGGGGVGKTALCIMLIQNHFIDEYDPTGEISLSKMITVDEETCILDIIDTAGQEEYPAMRDQYMSTSQGFLCTYAITSRSSFDEINSFREQILRVKGEDKVSMILVGNKCDLDEERQVTYEEGLELALVFGCPFFETSARDNINVEEAFFELVRETHKHTQEKNNPLPQRRTEAHSRCSIF